MFSPQDIDVFIMTHNRASYLKSSVNSLLWQSVKGFNLTILDNASTDDTKAVAESFAAAGVKYVQTPQEEGIAANFNAAQRLARAKYVMIFHDDDLLHPQYIETAINALNKFGEVNLILSACFRFNGDADPVISADLKKSFYIFENSGELAAYMYRFGGVCYASALYKTEIFKNADTELEKYGKNNDWPFLINVAGQSKVIYIKDKMAEFTRVHGGQDTTNPNTGITIRQLLNWQKLYFDKCAADNDGVYGRVFISRVYNDMKAKYDFWTKNFQKEEYSWPVVVDMAKKEGLLSPLSIQCGLRRHSLWARLSTFVYRNTKQYLPKEVKL